MPLTLPPFPNVPALPGVPALLRSPVGAALAPVTTQFASLQAQLKATLAPLGITFATAPQWGIFDSGGNPVLTGDNVVGVDYRREFRVATAPVEGGSFSSYNKVEIPFDVQMTFTKGGSVADRTAFLLQAKALLLSTKLYTAVVPEGNYNNVNVVHVDYRRTHKQGATLLMVEVGMQYIREGAAPAFSNTAQPSGAATTNTGPVQTSTPTQQQSAAISQSQWWT